MLGALGLFAAGFGKLLHSTASISGLKFRALGVAKTADVPAMKARRHPPRVLSTRTKTPLVYTLGGNF